jgi:hypothetical protein
MPQRACGNRRDQGSGEDHHSRLTLSVQDKEQESLSWVEKNSYRECKHCPAGQCLGPEPLRL